MRKPVKIAFHLVGATLSIGGAILLLFSMGGLAAGVAWSNGSFLDVLLLILFVLYALPAGAAMLFGGYLATNSANNEAYVAPTTQAQKTIGIILLLPAAVTSFLLVLGYPRFDFRDYLTILPVLLALALAGLGLWLLGRLWIRKMNNVTDPR